jgi:hypothetical protein
MKPPKPQKIQLPQTNFRSAAERAECDDLVKTDPDSLYRKLYNTSLPFFLWVIASEPAPYIFKLHV